MPRRAMLGAGDGVSLDEGKLQPARAFETNVLAAHLRGAALLGPGGECEDEVGALLIGRPSGKRPYALLVAPLLPARDDDEIAAARMVVFVADLESHGGALAPRLTQFFGLSKAEARVAAGIVEGRRLQEIARASDVRMPTVRTQLRAALKKIGVTRQADLVRVVLALPPLPPRLL